MTLDEARALLGVAPDCDRTQVRRAYLRAIKEAPPERDPERFMLLREAYDRLRRVVANDASPVTSDVDRPFAAYSAAGTEEEREAHREDRAAVPWLSVSVAPTTRAQSVGAWLRKSAGARAKSCWRSAE